MSDYQYCRCGNGLTPSSDEIIDGFIECPSCYQRNEITDADEMKSDLLKQLVADVEYLKALTGPKL